MLFWCLLILFIYVVGLFAFAWIRGRSGESLDGLELPLMLWPVTSPVILIIVAVDKVCEHGRNCHRMVNDRKIKEREAKEKAEQNAAS